MPKLLGCALVAATLLVPGSAFAGELRLSIANGRVTLVAQDVPLKQILDEWARVGQTMVVGAERLIGPPVTIELQDVPEKRALETLLRSASGYIAKPRAANAVGVMGASTYDRILIMPVSKPPLVSAAPTQFNRQQPQVVMPNVTIDDDGEPNPPNPVLPPGAVSNQMYMQPGLQVPGQQPQQPPIMTSPLPGMLPAPVPATPGMPFQPQPPNQQPQQPIRQPTVPGPGGGTGGGPGGA